MHPSKDPVSKANPKTILVASRDPRQADVRKQVLEAAGYKVISARNLQEVVAVCTAKPRPDMVLVGFSLPAAEKARVALEVRRCMKAPILQLYRGEKPDIKHRGVHYHESHTAEDFLATVDRLFKRSRRAAGAS